jgi:hypothetical protein
MRKVRKVQAKLDGGWDPNQSKVDLREFSTIRIGKKQRNERAQARDRTTPHGGAPRRNARASLSHARFMWSSLAIRSFCRDFVGCCESRDVHEYRFTAELAGLHKLFYPIEFFLETEAAIRRQPVASLDLAAVVITSALKFLASSHATHCAGSTTSVASLRVRKRRGQPTVTGSTGKGNLDLFTITAG